MRAVHVVLAALALAGCASFMHFSDPTAQAVTCGITSAVLGPLEALAASLGFPISVIESLYSDACAIAAAKGMTQHDAERFGLEHATVRARAMHAMGMRAVAP